MFLDVDGYASLVGPVEGPDRERATLLLQAASDRVRGMAPHVPADSAVARLVVMEVVRAAMAPGAMAGHVSYSKTIGPWSKSGTLSNPEAALRFSDEHRRLLGVSPNGQPHYRFGDE